MNKKVKVIYSSGRLRSISVDIARVQITGDLCLPCPSIPIRVEGVNFFLNAERLDIDSIIKGIEDHRCDGILYTTKTSLIEKEKRVYEALSKITVGAKTMMGSNVHIVTAVSTLWGKAALRPFRNQTVDFSTDIVWVPVENVARSLVYA